MKLSLQHNGITIRLDAALPKELELFVSQATCKQYIFHKKKEIVVTYQRMYQYVLSGLWKKMLAIQTITKIPVSIDGLLSTNENGTDGIIDNTISNEELEEWLDSHTFKYQPRWYQFESVYKALKFKLSRCEVATAGGKSFMIFLYCRYLLEKNKLPNDTKILIVTIRKMLVTQMVDDFKDYESTEPENEHVLKCDTVFSGGKNLANSNIVIGTYQTLSGYDKEYFDQFSAIIIDECHSAHIVSIKDEIIPKLNPIKCKYRYGLSGTQPLPNTIDDLHLEAYIGPVLIRIPAHLLQEEGSIAKIEVKMINLIYDKSETSTFYFTPEASSDHITKSLGCERKWVQYHQRRCNIIKNIATKFVGNQVVLVESVEYAKYLHQLFSTLENKQSYLIFGGTSDKERNQIKSEFKEDGDDKILVATYETMSTGVSINNIMGIHFPDGGKSRVRMRQSCGRGLRLHPSKEYLTVFDYVDILKRPSDKYCEEHNMPKWPGPKVNRLANQGIARKKIYEAEKFPIQIIKNNM